MTSPPEQPTKSPGKKTKKFHALEPVDYLVLIAAGLALALIALSHYNPEFASWLSSLSTGGIEP